MQVVKVLNNSLVLAIDEEGRENILMGKGIGYNKAIGNILKPDEVEKVFILKDKGLSKDMIRLAAEVDGQYFEIAKAVIDFAIQAYDMRLMDYLYLSLTDHIAFAVERVKNGVTFQNFYSLEMKKLNPNEYAIGAYAIQLIHEKLNVQLPKDEAGSIAFHFINAQESGSQYDTTIEMVKTVSAILEIVKYHFGIVFDEDGFQYTRFLTHLRLFVQRLLSDEQVLEQDDFLFRQIAGICNDEEECIKKIEIYVKNQFGKEITFQERVYLMIHIHRVRMDQNMIQ